MDNDSITDHQRFPSTLTVTETTTTAPNEHLYIPSTSTDSADSAELSTSSHVPVRHLLKDRLYVGNLHPSVDEYTLLQIFSKFGKITKLDFLFHKAGPLKGKPRGYAFIEYRNQDDALKALTKAHDKLVRGRKLVVTYAHQAPLDQAYSGNTSGVMRHKKGIAESGRPTTLSLIKSGVNDRHHARTEDKIAMMEAKLRQLESSNSDGTTPRGLTSKSTPLSSHPSLPVKPPPLNSAQFQQDLSSSLGAKEGLKKSRSIQTRTPLPSLPLASPAQSSSKPAFATPNSSSSQTRSTHTRIKFAGVKIVKSKDKQTPS